jgi:hypothetical protein
MTDTRSAASLDEDAFERWSSYAADDRLHLTSLPRRDRPFPPPNPLRPDMVEHWRTAGLGPSREYLRAAVECPDSDPAIAAALQSYLDGAPDPLGAAAALKIVGCVHPPDFRSWSASYRQIDAWYGEHGLELAVCATLERFALRVVAAGSDDHYFKHVNGSVPALVYAPTAPAGSSWNAGFGPDCDRIRELLTAMPETEYRRYRELLEPYGRSHRQRLVRAYFMSEPDWVDQVCAEFGEWEVDSSYEKVWIFAMASSLDQIAAAGITSIGPNGNSSQQIGTLVNAFGADGLPLVVEDLRRTSPNRWIDVRKHVLAAVPNDAGVEFLLTGMVGDATADLARRAAERFPRRTVRVLAKVAATADDPHLRSRLAHLAARVPVEAVATAEPAVREAIDRLLRFDGAPPEAQDLPALFTDPPWSSKRTKAKRDPVEVRPVDAAVLRWRDGERETWAEGGKRIDDVRRRLAEGGAEAVPDVLAALAKSARHPRALPPVGGVEAARIAADWLVRLPSTRASVVFWLARHGTDAVTWLTPDAVGAPGKPRRAAEAVLRHVARSHGEAAVLDAAAVYGDDARSAVAAILAADPLELDGRKAPRVPEWAEPILGMPVLTRDRRHRLPAAAVGRLVGTMMLDSLAVPYAGIDVFKEHCDAQSLREFSWTVFDSWSLAGHPAKDGWALTQLARFADGGTVERIEALIRQWSREGASKRAQNALQALGAIESEEALLAVNSLQRTAETKALKESAADQIDLIAAGMGLDAEQLADRLVPDFELGEDGTLDLDYGPRRFKIGFDERLRPFVIDERGKRRRGLPDPTADDDADLAAAAAEQYARLVRGLKSVANENGRLERAMIDGRTWSLPEFRRHLADHALMWHLVKRLVWQAESDSGTVAFRFAEDGTYTDVEENTIEPAPDSRIRLAHPLLLGETARVWAEILADYEILQPFDQLARPVHTPDEAELRAGRLTRFEGAKASAGALFGLTRKDWRPIRREGTGVTVGVARHLPGSGSLRVDFTPGFAGGYHFDAAELQVLQEIHFPADADPVALSEAMGALSRVTKQE